MPHFQSISLYIPSSFYILFLKIHHLDAILTTHTEFYWHKCITLQRLAAACCVTVTAFVAVFLFWVGVRYFFSKTYSVKTVHFPLLFLGVGCVLIGLLIVSFQTIICRGWECAEIRSITFLLKQLLTFSTPTHVQVVCSMCSMCKLIIAKTWKQIPDGWFLESLQQT